jgi:hypothetical protein
MRTLSTRARGTCLQRVEAGVADLIVHDVPDAEVVLGGLLGLDESALDLRGGGLTEGVDGDHVREVLYRRFYLPRVRPMRGDGRFQEQTWG